jgi:hypothetical protein
MRRRDASRLTTIIPFIPNTQNTKYHMCRRDALHRHMPTATTLETGSGLTNLKSLQTRTFANKQNKHIERVL